MTALLWFNEDGLNPDHPMVKDYPDSDRVYIFDLPYLHKWQIGKHRVQFIYESLLEIPNIQVYKGETVAVLRELIDRLQVKEVVTTETPNHMIKSWQQAVLELTDLITYPEVFPVQDTSSPRRFSRYWNKHDREWLKL